MPRIFRRRLVSDLAAAILVVFAAVSVGDIDDYGARSQAMIHPAVESSTPSNGYPDVSPGFADSGSESDHACSCLLCVMALSGAFGPQVHPPSPGTLPRSTAEDSAPSSHLPEVFHPPSA